MAWRTARWISTLRTCLRRHGELLLELIILRHQLAVLQRTGTRRPCFRPADRMFWVLLSRLWVDWRRGLMIPSSPRRFCVGAVKVYDPFGHPAHGVAGVGDGRGSTARSVTLSFG